MFKRLPVFSSKIVKIFLALFFFFGIFYVSAKVNKVSACVWECIGDPYPTCQCWNDPFNYCTAGQYRAPNSECYDYGGAAGTGAWACLGCYLDANGKGVYSVLGVHVEQTSATTASVTWLKGPGGNCNRRESLAVLVGRSESVVNADCGWDGNRPDVTVTTNPLDIEGSPSIGGLGGGGNGAWFDATPAQPGQAGTGGGGGGGFGLFGSGPGANGGSGVVIVRFPTGSIGINQTGGTCSSVGSDTKCVYYSSGSFTVTSGSTNQARLLVVAGGGAGGFWYMGGGGGAGGVIIRNNVSLTPQTYTVTVGAGGSGKNEIILERFCEKIDGQNECTCTSSGTGQGNPGGDSTFGSIIAKGGGGGGSYYQACTYQCKCSRFADTNGMPGGSGGGAHNFGTTGGSGIPGQGHDGGGSISTGSQTTDTGPGGGGGAGTAGQGGNLGIMGGNGGDGIVSDISGAPKYYGGGGAGGNGGFLPAGCYQLIRGDTWDTSINVTGLAPNTTYYFKVIPTYYFFYCPAGCNDYSCGCEDEYQKCANVNAVPNSCSASVNASPNSVSAGETFTLTTGVGGITGDARVVYSASPANFAFSPTEETKTATTPYTTTVQALRQTLSAYIISDVYKTSNPNLKSCTGYTVVSVTGQVTPWWQIKDADLSTNGNLKSDVPATKFFDEAPVGGFPGIPSYNGTLTGITSDTVSVNKWIAKSEMRGTKVYNSQYFLGQIPEEANPHIYKLQSGTLDQTTIDANTDAYPATGQSYLWYEYDGSTTPGATLTVSSDINVGSKKIILLVKGADLRIEHNINQVVPGDGFFMVVVGKSSEGAGGNIILDPAVGGTGPNLEGIYVADGDFTDGTLNPTRITPNPAPDSQFHLRGSLVVYGTVNLQRDVGEAENSTNPSELFEYAPDQILLLPGAFSSRRINWKEVAP